MKNIEKMIWVMGFFSAYEKNPSYTEEQCAYFATRRLESFGDLIEKLTDVVDSKHILAETVEYRTLLILEEMFEKE